MLRFVWFNYTAATMSSASARGVVANLLGANAIQVDTPTVTAVASPTGRHLLQVDTKDYPSVIVDANATSATNWEALNAQYTATTGASVDDLRKAGAIYATDAEGYVLKWFETPAVEVASAKQATTSSYDVMVFITLAVAMAVVARMAANMFVRGGARTKDRRDTRV